MILFGRLSPTELIIILGIVLIIVGPRKLPEVGQSIGKAIQNFRKASSVEIEDLEKKE